ncbi:hypothetical protein FXO38_18965 [Capsicum annuum]|uniref:Uncharacterized protein n=1 Tax=Capsicum annuum TaxID=4072 RepID=A0A2G2ZYH8_CAPAN|nr:hypothetical protein FXO37_34758 [Capsicum annuum]KAF3646835.1 hypothetical protein FXO38_18965 [Capsicum annuum]PHT87024.1 hypothetical protein T459_09130 [Capsicum annuum]
MASTDFLKCNLDGACKDNPGPSSIAFYIRDIVVDFRYAGTKLIEDGTTLEAKVIALRCGLEYCIEYNFLPVMLKPNSLAL